MWRNESQDKPRDDDDAGQLDNKGPGVPAEEGFASIGHVEQYRMETMNAEADFSLEQGATIRPGYQTLPAPQIRALVPLAPRHGLGDLVVLSTLQKVPEADQETATVYWNLPTPGQLVAVAFALVRLAIWSMREPAKSYRRILPSPPFE